MITDDTRKGIECKVFCSQGIEKTKSKQAQRSTSLRGEEIASVGMQNDLRLTMTQLCADRHLVASSEFCNIHGLVRPGNQRFQIHGVLIFA